MKLILLLGLFLSLEIYAEEGKNIYSFNMGLANKKQNTKKFVYGPGFSRRISPNLEINTVGLKHYWQDYSLSYGLESFETMRLGLIYPIHLRLEKTWKDNNGELTVYLSHRYYPEFYSEQTLTFGTIGGKVLFHGKYNTLVEGGLDLSRLYNVNQSSFMSAYLSILKKMGDRFFARLELTDIIHNRNVPHVKDWLITSTLGLNW